VQLGEAGGYHDPFTHMNLRPSMKAVAVSAILALGENIQVGAGPAVGIAQIEQMVAPDWKRVAHGVRVGVLAQCHIAVPARTRFFLNGSLLGALVGSLDVGPLADSAGLADPDFTMPPARVSFSYRRIQLGVGVRW
jgi:hypothetical protein